MAILNAIYLPGKPDISIKDDFSPVNTFRVILREYFGRPLQDLQTENWVYLSETSLWQFRDVHGDLTGEEPRQPEHRVLENIQARTDRREAASD